MFKSQKYGSGRKFILGRSSPNTAFGLSKRQYRKNLEKALAGSLLLALVMFRMAANMEYRPLVFTEADVTFEFIDIPEIPPEVEEKPKMQAEELVELPPAEEQEEAPAENPMEEEIAELLGEKDEGVELALANDKLGEFLLSDSPLGSLSGPELKLRRRRLGEDGDLALGKRRLYADAEGSEIDIGDTKRSQRKLVSEEVEFDLGTPEPQPRPREEPKQNGLSLDLAKNERVLSFASSVIGTEGYKLWNKINAELDRLNKGRYGRVPARLKRDRGGFQISFQYSDGVQHVVYWRRNGNVWIKVIGHSNLTAVQELRRVLTALLSLSLNQ